MHKTFQQLELEQAPQRHQRIKVNQCTFAETENIPKRMSVIDNEDNYRENNICFLYKAFQDFNYFASFIFSCFIFVEGHVWHCYLWIQYQAETLIKTVSI